MKLVGEYMVDENIEVLKILTNISKNVYASKKSNYSRIKNNKYFNDNAKAKLINQVINPIDLALIDVGKEINSFLNMIPIYNIFLKNTDGVNIYDAAELITEIKSIQRFKTVNNLLAYAGIYPNPKKYNKNLHKLLLRLSYKLINYNQVYAFVYERALLKYSEYNTNQEHIQAMARRIVIKRFMQNLFTHWMKAEEHLYE